MKKKLAATAAAANVLVLALCVLLPAYSSLLVLDRALYDFDMKASLSNEPNRQIVIAGIDDRSLKHIGRFPWDRKAYVPLIENLENAGVKAIAFDVMFSESGDPESDRLLAATLAKYDNIVFPVTGITEGKYSDIDNNASARLGEHGPKMKDVTLPIDSFAKETQLAHINADLDSDNTARKTFLEIDTPQGVFPSLALRAAQLAGVDTDNMLAHYPKKEMTIRYDLESAQIEVLPISQIIEQAPKLKNRIVVVGFTANGFENDDGKTPIEPNTKLVYVHANIINQLINGSRLSPESKPVTLGLTLLLALLPIWLAWRMPPTYSIAAVFAAAAVLLGGQYWIFAVQSAYINTVYPVAALFIGYLTNISIKTYAETRQKNYITKQFGRYVAPELVKQLAKSGEEIQLGGVSRELTILFLDVRGFTPLSEKLQPEEVVGFLNMMFDLITRKALENHGTIDKYIGDAAMILYNAPLDVEHHEYFAVKTACEIQRGMEQVRADVLDKYGVTIACGIGINTGPVVVGNIGSYLRVDYTAIGDNVNTAARIESNTQPNQVLVSEATYERTKAYFHYNCIGEKWMKGKSVPVQLYEVLGVVKPPEPSAGAEPQPFRPPASA